MLRFFLLILMLASLTPSLTAALLAGIWRLVEINSLPMQETPPGGQINRKEIYTEDGWLLVADPDAPSTSAKTMGRYEVHDDRRVLTSAAGESVSTAIRWMDADHFFFEFNPGERWYYARVLGQGAVERQWEPRSVAVIRMTEDGSGPTLRDFPSDVSDDSGMPLNKRLLGAWETVRISGSAVSGPDTPPYGMPNDRLLVGADGTLRKVHANGQPVQGEEVLHFKVEGNNLTLIETDFSFVFWFNHWGQLVFEQDGTQTIFKRISLDAKKAPAGPFVVVLLSNEREGPKLTNGKWVEVKKSALAAFSSPFPRASLSASDGRPSAVRPKPTFRTPFNGNSQAIDLALAENNDALQPANTVNQQARKSGLGSPSNILETNEPEKRSTIRADAIDSNLEVPFGWHVADNGDRMLVFDADHFIEISLEKKTAKSGGKALLQELLEAQRAVQPDLQAQLMDNSDGAFLLLMPNFKDKDGTKSRAFSSNDLGLKNEILFGQITSAPPDLVRALNLHEALMRNLKHQPKP